MTSCKGQDQTSWHLRPSLGNTLSLQPSQLPENSTQYERYWYHTEGENDYLLVGCLTSQQQASVSQGRIYKDNCTCCHTEIEVADPTFYFTQSQYTDTGPTSLSTYPIMPGAWQGSPWMPIFKSLVWLDPENSRRKRDSNPGSSTP